MFWFEKSKMLSWTLFSTHIAMTFPGIWRRGPFGLGPPCSLHVVTFWWIKALLLLSDENTSNFRIVTSGSVRLWGNLSAMGLFIWGLWAHDCPRDWDLAVILLHYEPTPTLFNATKFQMLLRNTVKVMVLKDFYVLQKPDFRLICRTACAV